jgi:hypothetical protein
MCGETRTPSLTYTSKEHPKLLSSTIDTILAFTLEGNNTLNMFSIKTEAILVI